MQNPHSQWRCDRTDAALEPLVSKNPGDAKLVVDLAHAHYTLGHLESVLGGSTDRVLTELPWPSSVKAMLDPYVVVEAF